VAKYVVRLQSFGNKKIDCIRIVRQFNPGMGLKEAKDLVETAPCEVLKTDDEEEARSMWRAFQELNTLGDLSNLCNDVRAHIICL
jgi:ribosomal protein L7/L12